MQKITKPAATSSTAARFAIWCVNTSAAKTKTFLIHCLGRIDSMTARSVVIS